VAWKRFPQVEGRLHSGSLIVALAGVESRESALAMKGFEVGVPRTALPAVHGEIYWED
jgi:ribosomal 30S subunit maturation factor RimM